MKRLGFALMASIVLVAGLGATAKVKGEGASAARPEPITAANVYEHEAHWPNIVALAEEWTPPGATSPLLPPTQGVLVRVEPDGMMRVDFGRHGKFDLPIAVSDLVSRANAVRTGKLHKHGPNFFLQIGTRLLDSSSERPRSIKSSAIADAKNYLVVFGNPDDDEFWQVTESLAALLSSGVASGETQPILRSPGCDSGRQPEGSRPNSRERMDGPVRLSPIEWDLHAIAPGFGPDGPTRDSRDARRPTPPSLGSEGARRDRCAPPSPRERRVGSTADLAARRTRAVGDLPGLSRRDS